MNREKIDQLLALYATGSLNDTEKRELYAAALQDPELFNALAEEDSIRELVELPGAKARLLDSLNEERGPVAAAAAPRRPLWFAWAAGMAVVAISAGISYVAFDRSQDVAVQVSDARSPRERAEPKAFTPPPPQPPAAVAKPRLDAPPTIASGPAALPRVNAPLPSAPPPAVREREVSRQEIAVAAQPPAPAPQAVSSELDQAKLAVNKLAASAAPASAGAAIGEMRRKAAPRPAATVWRRSGDGIWIRLTPTDVVDRAVSLSIRYTPTADGAYAVTAGPGFTQTVQGKSGEEFDVVIPPRVIGFIDGNTLRVTIAPRQADAFRAMPGARDSRPQASAETLTILLKEK